jgi:hypothetical protein
VKDESVADPVRDVAFNRIGELPKEQTFPRLFSLMDPKKWKTRYVAASLILKQGKASDVNDFLSKLPASQKTKIGMTEGLNYGGLIGAMEPVGADKPRDIMIANLTAKSFGARMTAFGYFYNGKKADIDVVRKFDDDKEPLPKCEKEDDCQWQCGVPKAGSDEQDVKEISTVGELVKICLIPTMTK